MTYLSDMHHSEIGYAHNLIQPDTERDKYEYQYEHWLNENYDDASQSIMGRHMTWEQACEDEYLFDDFMEEVRYQEMP